MDGYKILKTALGKPFNWYKKVEVRGLSNIILKRGILASNHVGWQDIPAIASAIDDKVTFIGTNDLIHPDKQVQWNHYGAWIYNGPNMGQEPERNYNDMLTKIATAIATKLIKFSDAMVPVETNRKSFNSFTEAVVNALDEDQLLCIFPSRDVGPNEEIKPFKLGLAYAVFDYYNRHMNDRRTSGHLPVYPVAVKNAQNSPFSRKPIYVNIGDSMDFRHYLVNGRSTKNSKIQYTKDLEANVRKLYAELP